jgi:hypothetical protein
METTLHKGNKFMSCGTTPLLIRAVMLFYSPLIMYPKAQIASLIILMFPFSDIITLAKILKAG